MIETIIKSLQYFPLKKNVEEFRVNTKKQNNSRQKSTYWVIREGIQAVDLYCYLNARFGPPNGLHMILRNDDSDNLIHWHYTLKYKENTLDIICLTFRLEIVHNIPLKNSDSNKVRFITKLKEDFRNYHRDISQVRNRIEKWKLFINPFFRIKSVIEHQLENLDSIKLDEIEYPAVPKMPDEFEKWKEKSKKIAELYTDATSLGLSIRMLAPVYAESFINLLIFLLAKEDIKNDKRLYESIIRQPIDIRVKTLHLNCDGFFQAVDYNNEAICKEFHSLMNNRNDLLHGNIDPTRSFYDTVYFDGKIPLFTKFRDLNFYSLNASIKNVTPDLAINDYQIVQNFIAYILICLNKETEKSIRQFMFTKDPGWNVTKNKAGILFPPHIVDIIPQFES